VPDLKKVKFTWGSILAEQVMGRVTSCFLFTFAASRKALARAWIRL